MSEYVMVYEHNGEVTTLPKPPRQPNSRLIRTLGFLLTLSYQGLYTTIIQALQKTE